MVYSSEKANRTKEPPDVQILFFPTGHSFEGDNVIRRVSGITKQVPKQEFIDIWV